jgi:hypothetical protein
VLTCISFLLHHAFPVIIHNQCSQFELVSPVYFGHNAIWYIPPDQKVDTNAMTKASLGRDSVKKEFTSALMYKLQRKESLKSCVDNTEDTSTSIQLLVNWIVGDGYMPFVNAMLIKHNNAILWDGDKLRKLCVIYRLYSCRIKDTWQLDNATILMITTLKRRRGRVFEITISEGTVKDGSMEPICVSNIR